MIPKKIHLCWLSGDPYPADIQECLDTWKEALPDYEVVLWDRNRFDIESTRWTSEAFRERKYAFAADYIRLYALYNYGGIYLDSDVRVFRSFDDLLHLPYFIGQDFVGTFEAAVIGAEKGCKWIGEVLERYKDRPFVKPDGEKDMLPLPRVFGEELYPRYRFEYTGPGEDYVEDGKVIKVFPREYFNSRDRVGWIRHPKAYCSHCYLGSWTKPGTDWRSRLKRSLPRPVKNLVFFFTNRLHAERIHQHDIPMGK